jgi:hypothetical protein
VLVGLGHDLLEALGREPEAVLDLLGGELQVEAQLEDGGVPGSQRLDDQTQRLGVEPDLRHLVRLGRDIGRRHEDMAGRVDGVGPPSAHRVGRATPGDLLEERSDVPDRLGAARLELQELGPCLLVELLRIPKPREVRAQHRHHGRAMGRVVPLDAVLGGRRGRSARRQVSVRCGCADPSVVEDRHDPPPRARR